jgi:hypothetical protein
MSDTVVAAIVGSLSGFLVSIISVYFAYKNLKSDYKGKFELEIISKQILACEALWGTLSIASRSAGDDKVLTYQDDHIVLIPKNARKMYDDINQLFNSPLGLYFSRNL